MNKRIIGIFHANPRGFGFVETEDKDTTGIFISKADKNKAIDLDIVEVEIKENPLKGIEGKIVEIIKREKNTFVGIVKDTSKKNYLVYVPILGFKSLVELQSEELLKIGDRVEILITKWPKDEKDMIEAKLKKYLAHISEASKDTYCAIIEYNIKEEFDDKTKNEAKNLKITNEDLKKRKDLTNLNAVTIDPKTARDFDDAISITKHPNNTFSLGVHITDVSFFVKANSFLDIEAAKRGNSVYFPSQCIPMLPKELSNNLCSLKEDQKRITVSVLMDFDENGDLKKYDIVRSYIKSKKRFSYEQAYSILKSKKENKYKNDLENMTKLCEVLKKKRFDRGSIDFALSDSIIILDENENPIKIEVVEYDITHQMIEEFMLKANEVIAYHLDKKKKKLIFRIHEEPSVENLEEFFGFARSLGFYLPKNPKTKDIQKLFIEAKKTKYLKLLSINFIKSMKLAIYSKENIGHFGLALEHYTHFTSPIRRYSDLVIQRILFEEEDIDINLKDISKATSEKERNAAKAENSVIFLKKIRLLKKFYKEDPNKKYQATITKIKPFGIIFEIDELMLDGFINLADIEYDYFLFEETYLRGRRTKQKLTYSDKIHIQIKSIDLITQDVRYFISRRKRK
ncbi:MAG: Ribonuclease R [Candidatus Anoxychlamydiales bacterium]|nr:Ribonuclease R [Candidatus Anoxychlamydiales bacterium]